MHSRYFQGNVQGQMIESVKYTAFGICALILEPRL